MKVLLDTHSWIWWATESSHLSAKAKQTITKSEWIGVSTISCWEVAMLVAKQKIGFSLDVKDWIQKALKKPKLHLLDLDPEILVESTRLPGQFHGDPVDRMLMATALKHGVPIISKDQKIKDWKQIQVIW